MATPTPRRGRAEPSPAERSPVASAGARLVPLDHAELCSPTWPHFSPHPPPLFTRRAVSVPPLTLSDPHLLKMPEMNENFVCYVECATCISSSEGKVANHTDIIPCNYQNSGIVSHSTHYRPALPFGNRKKNILEDLFSSVLSQKNITLLES